MYKEHLPPVTSILRELRPVSLSVITQYIPSIHDWTNSDIAAGPYHGRPHSFECLLLWQLLKPVFLKRGIDPDGLINELSLTFALPRHDVGRTTEDDEPEHGRLSVIRLIDRNLRTGKFNYMKSHDFQYGLSLCRLHDRNFRPDDPIELRLLNTIDIFTMFGRFDKYIGWLRKDMTPVLMNIIDSLPLQQPVRPEEIDQLTGMVMRLGEITRNNARSNGGDYYKAEVQASREMDLVR